jgi:hypothetical protein
MRHGYGTYYYSNKSKYRGYWENNQKHGNGKSFPIQERYSTSTEIPTRDPWPTTTAREATASTAGSRERRCLANFRMMRQ